MAGSPLPSVCFPSGQRGPLSSRIAQPGWEDAAADAVGDAAAEDASPFSMRMLRFGALSFVVLVLIVLALRRSS